MGSCIVGGGKREFCLHGEQKGMKKSLLAFENSKKKILDAISKRKA